MNPLSKALVYLAAIITGVLLSIFATTDGHRIIDKFSNDNNTEVVTEVVAENKIENVSPKAKVDVYVDPETGVNYLIYRDHRKGGITVRVDAEGKPIVNK